MTGGGFGGCVVALVPVDQAEQVRGAVTERFARHGWPTRSSTGCLLTAAAARLAAMAELLTATPPTNI
jgi:galactokinase